MKKIITLLFVSATAFTLHAQREATYEKVKNSINTEKLNQLTNEFKAEQSEVERKLEELRKTLGDDEIYMREKDGSTVALVGFEDNGRPIFFHTTNQNAAISTNTTPVKTGGSSGLNLTGNGIIVGEWDGGDVLDTHQEFGNRVTLFDNSGVSSHATHVAGTIMAAGVDQSAEGMANAATLHSWDFFNNMPDISNFAAGGNILSNHSYGSVTGWRFMSDSNEWRWYGDTSVSGTEDLYFGFYNSQAENWDNVMHANEYFAMVKSAGNDRGYGPSTPGVAHKVFDPSTGDWVHSSTPRPVDCPTGYNCIPTYGNSKNSIIVGAVEDVTPYTGPSSVNMSSFSAWGPTDDGRIKPDICGNGVGLYSPDSDSNSAYDSKSGTSMSGPNITGNIALLQALHDDLYGTFMKSATVKALIIETAYETGNGPGPDYEFGWGLMNTLAAAEVIQGSSQDTLTEAAINQNDTITFSIYSDGTQPLSATIAWNDPAGTPPSYGLNDTTLMLVNDLDMVIIDDNGNPHQAFIMDPSNPSATATTGNNFRDNVEKVYIAAPAPGEYTVQITHKGSLSGGSQNVSFAATGLSPAPLSSHVEAAFLTSDTGICEGAEVTFTDISNGEIQNRNWSFPGGAPTSSTDSVISVTYNQAGSYDVELIVTDTGGVQDTLLLTNHIHVDTVPQPEISFADSVCLTSTPVTVNASPAGGNFSGIFVSGNEFFPDSAGTGSHDIIYTVQNGFCSNADTHTVEVVPLPSVSHPDEGPYCESDSAVTFTSGTPLGGTYYGPGIFNDTFYSDSAGTGTFELYYEIQDASTGCTATDSFEVTVDSVPNATITDSMAACEGSGVFTLTSGSPSGGTYSGTGVNSGAGTFDPSVSGTGSFEIVYEVVNGACSVQDTGTMHVYPAPTASINLPDTFFCVNETPVSLSGGSPQGGNFWVDSTQNNVFDPDSAGAGTYTISYVFTDSNLCSDTASQIIEVDTCAGAFAQFTATNTEVCEGDTVRFINQTSGDYQSFEWIFESGQPATSTDTNPNVLYSTGGMFNVTLVVTDTAGIPDTLSVDEYIQVDTIPEPSVSFWNTTCIDLGSSPITISPAGGTLSGTGVDGTSFFADSAGFGQHDIIYEVSNNGCIGRDTHTTTVVDTPNVVHPDLNAICDGSTPFTPAVGSPSGGEYTGAGFINNVFYPDSAGIGVHQIEYYYSDANGCDNADSFTVEVVSGDSALLRDTGGICNTEAPFVLTTGDPAGGTYLGAGIDSATGEFDPSAAGMTEVPYQYIVNVGNCNAVDTGSISLIEAPEANLSQQTLVCSGADTIDLSGGTPQGGFYSGTHVVNDQFINPGLGSYTINYTVVDTATGCSGSDSAVIEVIDSVQVTMSDSFGICSTDEEFELKSGSPFGGIYSGNGVTNDGQSFYPLIAGADTHTITYTYDTNGCFGTADAQISVIQGPQVVLSAPQTACISENEVLLEGTPDGGFYSGTAVVDSFFIPHAAGVGEHDISYTYTDASTGCTATDERTIRVEDPQPEIQISKTEFCQNDNPVTLSGTPAPGNFAGTGVSGILFDPSASNSGLHRIEYRLTQGCLDTAEIWVRVHPAPHLPEITGATTAAHLVEYTYTLEGQSGISYNWNITGGTIIQENNNNVTVRWGTSAQGIISATQTNEFGCSDTSTLTVSLTPLSTLEQNLNESVTVYPNPANDHLIINAVFGQNRTLEYRLSDAAGRSLTTGRVSGNKINETLEVSQFAPGVYFLIMNDENNRAVKKVVIQ